MKSHLWMLGALLIASALCFPARATTYYPSVSLSVSTREGGDSDSGDANGTYAASFYYDSTGYGFEGVSGDAACIASDAFYQMALSGESVFPVGDNDAVNGSGSLDVLFTNNDADTHYTLTFEVAEQRLLMETADEMNAIDFMFNYSISMGYSLPISGVSDGLYSTLSYFDSIGTVEEGGNNTLDYNIYRNWSGYWELVIAPYAVTYDLGTLPAGHPCSVTIQNSISGRTVDEEAMVNFSAGDPDALLAGLGGAGITLTITAEPQGGDDEPETGAIPEPATVTLLGVGIAGAALARRRRSSAA